MGVKGLKNFISKHTIGALVTKNISRCRLLIDGSNLMYFLYNEHTKTNIAFGGDYDAFVDQVNTFFKALDHCSIESCVILDGGVSLRKSSIQHGIRTFRINTFDALNVTPEDPSEVVPALLRSVFVSTVRGHGVTILQADDIADDELCTLSATFGLPVLSADTDFCLRGVPVILLGSFDYRNPQEEIEGGGGQPHSHTYIKGQLFDKDTFCKLLDVNPEHVLLLTTLGMHDTLASFNLQAFVHTISKGLVRNRTWTERLFTINVVRKWLSQHKDTPLPQLVKMVVELHPRYTRPRKMEQLEQLLLRVVQVSPYSSKLLPWFSTGPDDLPCGHAAFVSSCRTSPPPGSDPLIWASVTPELMSLHRDKRLRVAQMTSSVMLKEMRKGQDGECPHADTELNFAGGLSLPRWFAITQKQALVHFDAAELLVKKTVFTHPMAEKMNRKSAYLIALPIAEVIMAICEKTYLEQERSFLQEQMELLKQSDCLLNEQVRKTVENQIIEHQVNHIQYMKALQKMNRKKKKEPATADRKPKFRMDWLIEEEKKNKRALKKKSKAETVESLTANPRNSVDVSDADYPLSEAGKQCPGILEEVSESLIENQAQQLDQLEEDADDIKDLHLNSAIDNEEMNFDVEEVGKGSINEYLGWFKNSKNYHALQIVDSVSVGELGDEEENCHNGCPEDDCLNTTNDLSNQSITETETQPSILPSKNILKPIADLKCALKDTSMVHDEATRDIASTVEQEKQRCGERSMADDTIQSLSYSHLEEMDNTLGADSDDEGSIFGEEELMNIPTSAFFCDKREIRLDRKEEDFGGVPHLSESSFNFDSTNFLYHQESNDAPGWSNDDDPDVIIETSEDDSDAGVTNIPSASRGNGLLPLQDESTLIAGEVLQTCNDESTTSHDEGLQTNRVDCSQALEDDSDVIIEDSEEDFEKILNGVSSERETTCSQLANDDQPQVDVRLMEEPRELGSATFPCNPEEVLMIEKERLPDCTNLSPSVDDSNNNKSGVRLRNFLKGGSKQRHTKMSKRKNPVIPVSEKKKNKKNKNNSLSINESSLNVTNPTDISVGADDSRLLPEHLTKGECEAKSYNDADFQIVFSGHCLKLEVRKTSFVLTIMTEIQNFYQSVCDDFRKDISMISEALEQGEDVESARDLLLERLNDRLMKNLRFFLEKACDHQLLHEGQEMSDNDYNICFLNGALQKLDVLKVIPYRERPFKWYIRKSFLRSLFVLKIKNDTNLSSVPALQELPTKSIIERKTLVCNLLNEPLNTYNCLPGELQLVLMSISYWYNHSSLRLNRCHVYTLLLCFVMYYFIDPCLGRERDLKKLKTLVEEENGLKGKKKKKKKKTTTELQLKNASANHNIAFIANHLDRYSCAVAAFRLAEYHKVNVSVTSGKLKKHFVHSMCEFQACFNYIGALNSLLGSPFSLPSIEQVLNCTFAYNAFRELSTAKYPGTVLAQWLGEKKQMTFLFDALHQFVGKAINMPMVLDLYPKVIQKVNKNGVIVTTRVASINLSEKLKKEQSRIEKENEMAQLEALAKEFEDLDLRKAQQAKRKAALIQKQVTSTPTSTDEGAQITSQKSLRAKNRRNSKSELRSMKLN